MIIDIKYIITILTGLIVSGMSAQTFSAKLIDDKTQESIPFATIELSKNRGIVSNENGVFTINEDQIVPSFAGVRHVVIIVQVNINDTDVPDLTRIHVLHLKGVIPKNLLCVAIYFGSLRVAFADLVAFAHLIVRFVAVKVGIVLVVFFNQKSRLSTGVLPTACGC